MLETLNHELAYQLFENINLMKKINLLEYSEVLETDFLTLHVLNIQTFQLL